MGAEPVGEPLVIGDGGLDGTVPPGRTGPEPCRQDVVGTIEVAEVDRAEQLARRNALQLIRQQRPAQHGHPAVQGYRVGQPQPGIAPCLPAQRGDLQGEVHLEHVAVRQQAAQRPGDRRLARSAGAGHHEQRKARDRHAIPAARTLQHGSPRIAAQRRVRTAGHAEDLFRQPPRRGHVRSKGSG